METFQNGILIGSLSSILATIIIFTAKKYFKTIINSLFFQVYPNVKGQYKLIFDDTDLDEKNRGVDTKLFIEQLGNKISGESITNTKDGETFKYNIDGRVTASRYIFFNTYNSTNDQNQFETGHFRITSLGESLEGHFTFICSSCEVVHSSPATLKKVK